MQDLCNYSWLFHGLEFCRVSHVLDQLDDAVKEVHPQTDRERQLERQLESTIRRLHSGTIKAMEKQRKLEEQYLQATEKLESYEDHYRLNKECMEQTLQDEQEAKQELLDLKQLHHAEQALLDEWRSACERFLRRKLDEDISEGGDTTKSQENASTRIEMLEADSEFKVRNWYLSPKFSIPEEVVKEALDREHKLHNELNMSDKRQEKLKLDLQESMDGKSVFANEVRQSVARETQFQSLLSDRETKIQQAKDAANHAGWAVRKELVLVEKQEKVFQQEVDMSSERIRELKQEISQTDKRQRWLDEVKSTCSEDGRAYETHQQTADKCSLLKPKLQQVLQSEEEVYQRLQQMHEREKHSKWTLEMTSERLKNTREKIDRMWKGAALIGHTCLMFENEAKLQESLKEACVREQRLQEAAKRLLSEEKQLQQKLRQMSEQEEIFDLPLRQLKYRRSGECSLFFSY